MDFSETFMKSFPNSTIAFMFNAFFGRISLRSMLLDYLNMFIGIFHFLSQIGYTEKYHFLIDIHFCRLLSKRWAGEP